MEKVTWKERYRKRITTADQAVQNIKSGNRVFVGSGCAEPQLLVKSLVQTGERLADTEVIHILTLGVAPYVEPRFTENFRANAFFVGPNIRQAVAQARADYTPMFLSEIPRLFKTKRFAVDVALIQTSTPDEHGYCSYGVSVDIVKAAAENADLVIAEVNSQMPRTLGDSFIHIDDIDLIVDSDQPILETLTLPSDELSNAIGRQVARLVSDGSTIQAGIGTIPDAVLCSLMDKRDLVTHGDVFRRHDRTR